jgi:hypothetical protein
MEIWREGGGRGEVGVGCWREEGWRKDEGRRGGHLVALIMGTECNFSERRVPCLLIFASGSFRIVLRS